RGIEPADRDGRRVVVINRAMAERFWPGRPDDAVGREFRLRWGDEPYRVVGVVNNYKTLTPGESPRPYMHLPFGRKEGYGVYLVRTSTAAAPMIPRMERELRALNPDLVIMDRGTLRD